MNFHERQVFPFDIKFTWLVPKISVEKKSSIVLGTKPFCTVCLLSLFHDYQNIFFPLLGRMYIYRAKYSYGSSWHFRINKYFSLKEQKTNRILETTRCNKQCMPLIHMNTIVMITWSHYRSRSSSPALNPGKLQCIMASIYWWEFPTFSSVTASLLYSPNGRQISCITLFSSLFAQP